MADAYAIALHPYETNTSQKESKMHVCVSKIQKMNIHTYLGSKKAEKKIRIEFEGA